MLCTRTLPGNTEKLFGRSPGRLIFCRALWIEDSSKLFTHPHGYFASFDLKHREALEVTWLWIQGIPRGNCSPRKSIHPIRSLGELKQNRPITKPQHLPLVSVAFTYQWFLHSECPQSVIFASCWIQWLKPGLDKPAHRPNPACCLWWITFCWNRATCCYLRIIWVLCPKQQSWVAPTETVTEWL